MLHNVCGTVFVRIGGEIYRLLGIGYWLLGIGYRILGMGYRRKTRDI